MIEAVVFDMDGLLVDSEDLWQRARIEAFGVERLRWTEADQRRVMGSNAQAWAAQMAERLGDEYTLDEIIERVVSQMESYYREAVPLLPGAHEVIDSLRGQYVLGLASGSSQRLIRAALQSAGWTDVFAEVLTGDDVAHGKPAPDMYLEVTRRLGVPVEMTAVFEDSTNGILAGHAAGVKVIAIPSAYLRPPDDVLQKADLVLSSLLDFIPDMLQRL